MQRGTILFFGRKDRWLLGESTRGGLVGLALMPNGGSEGRALMGPSDPPVGSRDATGLVKEGRRTTTPSVSKWLKLLDSSQR